MKLAYEEYWVAQAEAPARTPCKTDRDFRMRRTKSDGVYLFPPCNSVRYYVNAEINSRSFLLMTSSTPVLAEILYAVAVVRAFVCKAHSLVFMYVV